MNILIAALILVAYLAMVVTCIIETRKIEALRKAYDNLSVDLTEKVKKLQGSKRAIADAEAIYNAGYRKIPEGYHAEIKSADDMVKEANELIATIKAERKQAVEEFAQKIKDGFAHYLRRTNFDGHKNFDIDYVDLCCVIDDILKQNEEVQNNE